MYRRSLQRSSIEIAEAGALEQVLDGKFAVLSAAPFHLTTRIAEAAAKSGVHYLDLTEDVASTRIVKQLSAMTATTAFIPQCGLAPGFISIVANDLAKRFDRWKACACGSAHCRNIRPMH